MVSYSLTYSPFCYAALGTLWAPSRPFCLDVYSLKDGYPLSPSIPQGTSPSQALSLQLAHSVIRLSSERSSVNARCKCSVPSYPVPLNRWHMMLWMVKQLNWIPRRAPYSATYFPCAFSVSPSKPINCPDHAIIINPLSLWLHWICT